jgi:DNA invertase Pin-like site-specific DNA recombinase
MSRKRKLVEAVAYMRTSTSTNVGEGKDSEKRQRAAIEAYAKAAGYAIAPTDWFYDAAVKGADPVTARPGFASMMDRIAGNGVRSIIVESPDRFARDLAVQLAGHDYLKNLGVALIPASAPDFFSRGYANSGLGPPGPWRNRAIRKSNARRKVARGARAQEGQDW